MPSTLERLASWYSSQCDGDWEHQQGIKIDTLDNPGWSIEIDLLDTPWEERAFEEHRDEYEHAHRWLRCWLEGYCLHAACGPNRLDDALSVLLDWLEGNGNHDAG